VRRAERGASARGIAGPLLLVSAAAALLIVAQPDMGTALVIACICLALLFGSGIPMGPVLKTLAVLGGLAFIVAMADPYRRARLFSFLNPSAHQSGSGYQVVQSLIGLGSGHLFGLGLGSGRQKWGLLPNAHTDFIFSVIGEELGLLGALFVLCAFGVFAWFGLRAATRAPDVFGRLLAVAVVVWIVSETAINIGAVTGLLPVTGIPLPFISFGGSSLVITMLAAGILVSVARAEQPVTAGLRLVTHGSRPSTSRGRHPVPTARRPRGGRPPR
jgi:cell division protein FtsW